jgi:hypothetical protein
VEGERRPLASLEGVWRVRRTVTALEEDDGRARAVDARALEHLDQLAHELADARGAGHVGCVCVVVGRGWFFLEGRVSESESE